MLQQVLLTESCNVGKSMSLRCGKERIQKLMGITKMEIAFIQYMKHV